MTQPHSTFRLSSEARRLLKLLAQHFGINMTAALEYLIRERSRSLGLVRRQKKKPSEA